MNKNRKLTIDLNRRVIEFDHLNNSHKFLKEEHDHLKTESNKSAYLSKHSISLADDYRTKLEVIKQKHIKQVQTINTTNQNKIIALNKLVENFSMRSEEIHSNYRNSDETIGMLIESKEIIRKEKVDLENHIFSMKSNNEELNIKVTEFQNLIIKVESESKDSIRLKNDLENKNKMQRNRED